MVLGVFSGRVLHDAARQFDAATGHLIQKRIKQGDFNGGLGQTLALFDPPGLQCARLVLMGCGKRDEFDLAAYRKACTAAAMSVHALRVKETIFWLSGLPVKGMDTAGKARHAAESFADALYFFDQMKSQSTENKPVLSRLAFGVDDKADKAGATTGARIGDAIANGTNFAKDLGNLPGNVCTPTYLAQQAQKLARGRKKIKTTVLDQKAMEKLGMGSLLSVARGSRQPPKLIIMEYRGGGAKQAPVALVGKGLTFDAGGISLKQSKDMDEMKYDMCGGSSVFGTLIAASELDLPINVVGVVPSSENLPDGDANKPGDIVTSMSGQTIEVLNTDAEGRLILCDALTYTARYKPAVVIDIATLTGACVVALGKVASGLFSNDDQLADQLLAAGERSQDRVWRLPLWTDYQALLDSNFADMANIGGPTAGAITAACFLARFTREYRWAHLDIAGTAWKVGKEKGSTGRVVPLLTQFLIDHAA